MKIFIDPGHNYSGADTGAVGNGLREQDITFSVAEKLKKLFVQHGYEIKMSRNKITDNVGTSVAESIQKRYQMSNDWGADLFLSLHCNSGGGTGTESLVYSSSGEAAQYAERISAAIVSNLGLKNRGVKVRTDLGVLRGTTAPAVLVELGFIDNAGDAKLLKEEQQEYANAIFEGVTGMKAAVVKELTSINDIVWEYAHRGIVTDPQGMIQEMEQNPDGRLYWLARKALQYMRERGI